MDDLLACLRDCAENEVPVMVMHGYIGFDSSTPTQEGIEIYGKVVAEAERLAVKLAFKKTPKASRFLRR